MSWNLKSHILDHSVSVHNRLGSKRAFNETDSKNQHFTISIDVAQLILNHKCSSQKDIDKKMKVFMNDLIGYEKTYTEIKGKTKQGKRIYRDITFNFKDDLLLAYHNSSSDNINSNNYSVNPHFHFLAHKSLKIGRGYKYLIEAVETVAKKHNLVFNLMEETNNHSVNKKAATDFTWFVKRSTDKHFTDRIKNGWVEKALEKFQENYKQTGNLQYLLKGYKDLEERCKRLKVKHNLNLNLFLTEQQKETIKTLYAANDKPKIYELLSDRSNHIARAYIEHSANFPNIIISEIERSTGIKIPVINLDLRRVNVKIEQKERGKKDYTKSLNYCYTEDLKIALKYAKKEKELALIMQRLGYQDFQFKVKNLNGSRQRVGFSFKNKKKRLMTIYFNNLKTDMKKIRADLLHNTKNPMQIPEHLYSHLEHYTPRVSKNNLLFEEIYDLQASIDLKDFFIREFDEHIEFKNKNTVIMDAGKQIVVKRQSKEEIEHNVILMADMVKAKGWTICEVSGTAEFKQAMKTELEKRAIKYRFVEQKNYVPTQKLH